MSEEILGILPAKQGTLVFTSQRLVIQEKGMLARLSDGPISTLHMLALQSEVRDSRDAQKRALEFSQTPLESLLADEKTLVLPYSSISRVEYFVPGISEFGFKFFAVTEGKEKKHQYSFIDQYLALGWKLISSTLEGKITYPQDYRGETLEEFKNSECYVLAEDYCRFLRDLGIEAAVASVSPVNCVAALIKLGGRSISYLFRDYSLHGGYVRYLIENVQGKLDYTKTKRRGKGEQLDFEWVGDKQLSSILNQDSTLKSSILRLMSQNSVKDIYIDGFKDKDKPIKLVAHEPIQVLYEGKFVSFHVEQGTPYPHLPSREYFDAVDKVAFHIRSLLPAL